MKYVALTVRLIHILISRSSLLSSGDFTSGTLSLNDSVYLNYAVYDVSSGGAIKALAYTKDK